MLAALTGFYFDLLLALCGGFIFYGLLFTPKAIAVLHIKHGADFYTSAFLLFCLAFLASEVFVYL